jgi:hypothetical protein
MSPYEELEKQLWRAADELPPVFIKAMYEQKCNLVWQHVYDVYGTVG